MRMLWWMGPRPGDPDDPDAVDVEAIRARWTSLNAIFPAGAAPAAAADVHRLAGEVDRLRAVLRGSRPHPFDRLVRIMTWSAAGYALLLCLGLAVVPPWWPVPALAGIAVLLTWTVWSMRGLSYGRTELSLAATRSRAAGLSAAADDDADDADDGT